jgi:hypothetical protein
MSLRNALSRHSGDGFTVHGLFERKHTVNVWTQLAFTYPRVNAVSEVRRSINHSEMLLPRPPAA